MAGLAVIPERRAVSSWPTSADWWHVRENNLPRPQLYNDGISAAAAAMHDIGQILAAILVMGTTDVVAYLPLLLVSAIPMGLLTGAIIQVLSTHLKAIHFM